MSGNIPKLNMPALPLEGGCECGQLRYRVTETPVTFYACHCKACQKQSGSAFGMSMMIPASSLEIEGPVKRYNCLGGSGREQERVICPSCGCRISHGFIGGELLVLKPGTLDDTSWLKPAGHMFVETRQPWVEVSDEDGLIYGDKPDIPALRDRWSAMIGK